MRTPASIAGHPIHPMLVPMRHGDSQNLKIPMFMSLVTVVLLLFSGWLGGKMVFEAGVGVDTTPR